MTALPPYRIRRAATADAAIVGWHRAAMFRDMGQVGEAEFETLLAASRGAMHAALASGDYLGWLVERDGAVTAGGGLVLRPLLPRPGYVRGGTEAYVLNVYCEPAERRCGLARRLMQTILAWCAEQAIDRVSLHASDGGRPLYLGLGFAPTNELRRGD
ncbi:MAG: GNAT family N-acetyltransferase [bacterium]